MAGRFEGAALRAAAGVVLTAVLAATVMAALVIPRLTSSSLAAATPTAETTSFATASISPAPSPSPTATPAPSISPSTEPDVVSPSPSASPSASPSPSSAPTKASSATKRNCTPDTGGDYPSKSSTSVSPGGSGWFEIIGTCTPPPCRVTAAFPDGSTAQAGGPTAASTAWKWTFQVPSDPGDGSVQVEVKCGSDPGATTTDIAIPIVRPTTAAPCTSCFWVTNSDSGPYAGEKQWVFVELEPGVKNASCNLTVEGPNWSFDGKVAGSYVPNSYGLEWTYTVPADTVSGRAHVFATCTIGTLTMTKQSDFNVWSGPRP